MNQSGNPIVTGIKDRIKQAREAKQLTQGALAKLLGISRTAITQWEAGLTFPSYEKAWDMAKLLNVRPEWIAFGVDTAVEYRLPTEAVKAQVVQFGETVEDRKVVGTHYLSKDFVRDTLRCDPNATLFVYVLESESFSPRFMPLDHLVIDASATKVTAEGQYLIWNGLTAQVVTIQVNFAEPGTVLVKASDRDTQGNSVDASKLIILGRIKGRLGASH